MLIDSKVLSPDSDISAQVCIVGAGPAGISIALKLQEAGMDVVLIESGDLEPDEETQLFGAGEVTGIPYGPLETTRVRAFGGTANAWGASDDDWTDDSAQIRPLDKADFLQRSWVTCSGWPFEINELRDWYDVADAICGAETSDYLGDKEALKTEGLQIETDRLQTVLFSFGKKTRFTADHRRTLCDRQNIRVYYHATVTKIETNVSGSHVFRVFMRAPGGATSSIQARYFVLACGGIENARLLLAARAGHGLGNDHDLVGRFFMEHPHGTTGFFVPADKAIEKRMAPYAVHKESGGSRVKWFLGLTEALEKKEKLLRYAVSFWPTEAEPDWMPDDLVDLAIRKHSKFSDKQAPQFYAASFMSEQAPNANSRVTLSNSIGEDGLPLPCLDWRLSEIDIRTMIRGQQIIQEAFHIAGIGVFFSKQHSDSNGGFLTPHWGGYEASIEGAHHHMGTTRMHADPKQGVVDANCRMHSTENLFIAGSSVFPTGGFANPTLTIVALAVRLADHIRQL
jgi:choline dehydrogenase-like flavoprotein